MQVIVFDNGQGGVGVIYPVASDLTIEDIAAKDVPQGARYQICDIAADIDRTFRPAWVFDDTNGIGIDIARAKDVWRDKMRAARAPLLDVLDVAFMRAIEAGTDTTTITAKKQALRDVTKDPRIDAAADSDTLKTIWPDILEA